MSECHPFPALGQACQAGLPWPTIWRELQRNANKSGSWHPVSAEGRYLARRQRQCLLECCKELVTFVIERLHENITPEQIAGWLASGAEKALRYVSHETIYAWIHSRALRTDKLWKLLSCGRARRGRRRTWASKSLIKDRIPIAERPEDINRTPPETS